MRIFFYCFFLLLTGCASQTTITPLSVPEVIMPPQNSYLVNYTPLSHPKNQKCLIVIDAGHGGEDFGAHSNTLPHYQEKHLNLSTANLLQTYLSQLGYQTIMTRTDDHFIALDKRADFANEKNPDLFVSVHYNSAPSKEAEGIEVYFYRSEQDKKRTRESRLLAQCVLDDVLESTDAKSRGVKHGNFAVIRQTKMPAILIEGGFLTNDREMQKIKDPVYLKKLAWGIAQGIHSYLDK
jgi:N-acetylmuramoyl-L-alanine amidase